MNSLASRFIDRLPEENIEKQEVKEQNNDFFFNQDIELNEGTRSRVGLDCKRKLK